MKQNSTPRPRVGFLVACWGSEGGVIRVACQLVNRMVNDADVHLIELHGTGQQCPFRVDERVHMKSLLAGEGERLSGYLKLARKPLRAYCREHDLDVLFLLGSYPGVMGMIPGSYYGTKTIFCDHGAIENQLDDKQITLIRRVASHVCKRTVSLTHRNAEAYPRYFHTKASKVEVIANWIPDVLAKKNPTYNVASTKALWVGRLDPEKGVDHLISIVDAAQDAMRKAGWSIDVFGKAVLGGLDGIKEDLAARGIEDLICLKGSVDDIYDRYEQYGLFLLTSYREGLPLCLLESQACGVPGISFDVITGPSDIVKDGVNGRLIEPYDSEAFAQTFIELINDDAARQKMADMTRTSIEPFFEDPIYKQWISLVNRMMR